MDEKDIKKISEMIQEELQAAIDRAKSNEITLQTATNVKVEIRSTSTDLTEITKQAHESLNKINNKGVSSIPGYCQ